MADVKRVYTFGNKEAEGNGKMRELLGGKGANLAEMNLIGIPVPPGFTITTEVCAEFYSARQRGRHRDAPPRGRKGDEEHRETDRHEIRRQGDAAARIGTFGRTRLDARHDGHHPQPGYERRGRGRPLPRASGNPAFRMGLVPPLRTDVRRRGAGHETAYRRTTIDPFEGDRSRSRRPRRASRTTPN